MNLHGIVRGAITSVNPDILAVFRQSTGNTVDAAGNQAPQFTDVPDVLIQVQAAEAEDLTHINNFNQEGVYRAVYMYGNTQGVVRPNQKGGDILQFPQTPDAAVQDWLVVKVSETWPDWSKVTVCLQL